MTASSTWLYMRGSGVVRIVIEGRAITVHGPGHSCRRAEFADVMDAVLYHASVERSLLTGGWILERHLATGEETARVLQHA